MTIDELRTLHEVHDFIKEYGADRFLQMLPTETSQALASAILADHVHDYDKKKAALLRGK